MRSSTPAGLLLHALHTIACQGGSRPSWALGLRACIARGFSRSALEPEEPLLADLLGAATRETQSLPELAPGPSEEVTQRSASASSSFAGAQGGRRGSVQTRGGSEGAGLDAASVFRHRERRLVAAALQPASALHQVPSAEQPTQRPIDAGGLRLAPRVLPSLFRTPMPTSPVWGGAGNARGGLGDEALLSHHAAPASSSGGSSSRSPSASSTGSSGRRPSLADLRGPRVQSEVPKALREQVCRHILADFLQASRAAMDDPPAHILTWWEIEAATKLRAEGGVSSLVRLLASIERQWEKCPKRRSLLRSAVAAKGPVLRIEEIRDERRELLAGEEWRKAAVLLPGERQILGLYLDGQLTWLRINALWSRAQLAPPQEPDRAGERDVWSADTEGDPG
mmetsp:Transcript_31158/g.89925  ORF Transcript_31158/g.89925 Transcript_31158/m.89925 type:complete len:396 (-) Transcript_31158:44-1231(-)